MKKILCILIVSIIATISSKAQLTEIYREQDAPYKKAYELFIKEKYSAAKESFDNYLQTGLGTQLNRINAEYYAAVSAYELFHPDVEKRLNSFIELHPESTKAPLAYFYLGRHYYRLKQYRNALPAFEKADVYYLVGDEVAEYYFKTGYCYFNKNENEKAAKNFHEILNVDSKYQTAAQYYYGHIAYSSNNYKTAIEYFSKLDSSATFGPLVPYYITQMYYEQGKYDELIKYAIPILKNRQPQNSSDITRLIAEAYYRKGDYKNAIEWFNQYSALVPAISRDDEYSIGYSKYRGGEFKAAISNFEKVVLVQDSLAQNAYYHLADCFLQMKNKQSARNAFQSAAKLDYNPLIKETSQFNYAKLSYELNFQPVAINAFREFLKNYPKSKYADDANELIAGLFLTTRNYKDALAALDNIKDKNTKAKGAYQKVAYYRGVEFFNDGDKDKAINMFEKAIINDVDPNLRAMAMYWKAETLYAQKKYEAAIKQYRIYIFNPGSVNTGMYNLANYNVGYCNFKLANYSEAATWFRKYLAKKSDTEKPTYDDALIRTGDCSYASRNFDDAMDYYNQAIQNNASSSDYCMFQRGVIQGVQGNSTAKAATMASLLNKYPKSQYKADALYENGKAQMTSGNNDIALSMFNQLLKEYPSGQYRKKAMLNTGLIYYGDKKDEQALDVFKKVITEFPATAESAEALASVKNIYVANGKPDDYFAYVKSIPNASVSAGAQDSITYEAAETRYLKGDFEDAAKDFERYLSQFPNGSYRMNATFYKAESDFRNKNDDAALSGYESIIAQNQNIYTEKSLLKAAGLNFKKKNYSQATEQYIKLEQTADLRDNILAAQQGLMRSYYQSEKYEQTITYAQKLLASDKVSNETQAEAHLLYARSAMKNNDLTTAKKEFTTINKQSSSAGAEAKYNLAYIEYKLANYKSAQTKCFDVINQVPSYDFWIGKSFLLLAENYIALKDTFQATHTLKSIIDGYEKKTDDVEDIRAMAQQRYDEIIKDEELNMLKPEEQPEKETDLSKEQQH
ncbi:tetratricopeptide repeat protein [soil metagenome]